MRIVFYSTNSNVFDENTFKITVMPRNEFAFREFCNAHPEYEFFCVTQLPGMFLPEKVKEEAGTCSERSSLQNNIRYLPLEIDSQAFSETILSLKPDLAIAMTFWIEPYDWLSVNDAIVAEKLESCGVRTVCHSVETGLVCFDKWRTHNELARLGFEVPAAVFCDHDLYFCAGSNREVLRNVYKESVLAQITKLRLPLIIKDTTGLSSYGMTVAHSYGEVAGYLNSKRNNSNRLIEEFISGRQFGLEIYGLPGAYQILSPFEFSVNQYGITSPKQSVKYGPCELPAGLRDMMIKLADSLGLCGAAQVDLVLDDDGAWHIIEVNPRLSGMTYTYAAACGLSVFEMIYKTCMEQKPLPQPASFVMSLKLPLMKKSQMETILKIEGVKLLNQTNDLAAKQEREKGFCECIIAANKKSILQNAISRFLELFPEDAIVIQAKKMIE